MVPAWRKIPFLRWSFLRMMFGMKHLLTAWQVGDGREARLAEYVVARARAGDAADAICVIDGSERGHTERGQALPFAVDAVDAGSRSMRGQALPFASLRACFRSATAS